jgi:hypothetical protein
MLQLVRFSGCVHIFDTEKRCFVKTTSKRLLSAVGLPAQTTEQSRLRSRKLILEGIEWVKCSRCNLGSGSKPQDREHDHWIAAAYRGR